MSERTEKKWRKRLSTPAALRAEIKVAHAEIERLKADLGRTKRSLQRLRALVRYGERKNIIATPIVSDTRDPQARARWNAR